MTSVFSQWVCGSSLQQMEKSVNKNEGKGSQERPAMLCGCTKEKKGWDDDVGFLCGSDEDRYDQEWDDEFRGSDALDMHRGGTVNIWSKDAKDRTSRKQIWV